MLYAALSHRQKTIENVEFMIFIILGGAIIVCSVRHKSYVIWESAVYCQQAATCLKSLHKLYIKVRKRTLELRKLLLRF